MSNKDSRARSVSGELESSDLGSPGPNDLNDGGSSHQPGKPGRKKNPNSQAARRDQNRIAQREFRLRKQQRIRDLEASVEILSGGKEEALAHLRKIMKDLMHENHVLRGLLRNLSNFIGDGAGGLLPKLGWDINDFNNFLNKGETDTAWESYQRNKQDSTVVGSSTTTTPAPPPAAASGSGTQKRAAEEDPFGIRTKRPRSFSDQNGDDRHDIYPSLVPLGGASGSGSASVGGMYSTAGRSSHSDLFDLMRGSPNSPMFVPSANSPSNASGQFAGPSPSATAGYTSSYLPSMHMAADPNIPPISAVNTRTAPAPLAPPRQAAAGQPVSEEDMDPKRNEAYKLIHYHLDNFKRNHNYCLPSSLRPTLVQRSIAHEGVIDSILHPELRDRMILLRARFDLVECLHDYRTAVTIHGDDVLAHSNWEISENWIRRYKVLIDQETLAITNRWRRERGDPELRLSDMGDDPQGTPV
ncbi:hypothetical protein CERSUDRAFT_111163 [Gelatoporia subvermispora B]|uniref:BZIP domain-containing protein n=1 Tax=Ceriporiopsis subvermispora (strain B) TaxID=914234 RepID=M2QU24_CERS8|nr:hypothetical protein CERSUDRAFT_111163 [Gelatoporia subvermispora B]